MKDIIIQAVSFVVLSAMFIAVGLRILTAKRPFIVSRYWHAIICCGPVTAFSLTTLWRGYPAQSWLLAFLIVGGPTILWGIVLWSQRGGFVIVIGTTGTALRDVLRLALHRLSLPYEESAQAFRLPTLNNELPVEAMAFKGMFVLRLKKSGDRSAFRQLTAEINDFFRTAPAQTNRRLSYALVVIGAAYLLFGSWLTYERLSLESKMRASREAHTEFIKSSEK